MFRTQKFGAAFCTVEHIGGARADRVDRFAARIVQRWNRAAAFWPDRARSAGATSCPRAAPQAQPTVPRSADTPPADQTRSQPRLRPPSRRPSPSFLRPAQQVPDRRGRVRNGRKNLHRARRNQGAADTAKHRQYQICEARRRCLSDEFFSGDCGKSGAYSGWYLCARHCRQR